MASTRATKTPALRSERLTAALERALADERGGDDAELKDLLGRSSGLPGPQPNIDLARTVGLTLATRGARGDRLIATLAACDDEYLRLVAAMGLAACSLPASPVLADQPSAGTLRSRVLADQPSAGTLRSRVLADQPSAGTLRGARKESARATRALADLQTLAEDPRHGVRAGVVHALRLRLGAMGAAAVDDLKAWTDGYLHAHVALEAMADRTWLTTLPTSEALLARLEEAFVLADRSSRSAERSQGMRTLRQGMGPQIACFASRFPEVLVWLEGKTKSARPETREVLSDAVRALRRSVLSDKEALRFTGLLEASAKPRRDLDRVVQGTRKRGRGRT
jgi:hypothetical protein